MKFSVSITPEALHEFGAKRIVEEGYATQEQMETNPNKGWSRYVQDLIRRDMKARSDEHPAPASRTKAKRPRKPRLENS